MPSIGNVAFARYGNLVLSLSLSPPPSLPLTIAPYTPGPSLLPSAPSSLFSSTPFPPLFLHKATNKTPLHTYIPVGQERYGSGYTPTNYYQRCPGILPQSLHSHTIYQMHGEWTQQLHTWDGWLMSMLHTHTHTHTHTLTHTQYYTTLHGQEHYI